MQLIFDEIEEQVAKTFRVLLEREATTERIREVESSHSGADGHLWHLLIGAGALDVGLPGDAGGLLLASIVAEMIGEHLAPAPFTPATCAYRLAADPAARCGAHVAEIASGTTLLTVVPMQGRVTEDAVLVPAGTVADAALTHDATGLWWHPRPDGVVRPQTLDAGCSALWPVDSTDRRLLASGAAADGLWAALQSDIRVLIAAELVGMASRAIEIAVDYARTRVQFGRLIGSYQGVSHPLADAATAVEGARLLVRKAAWSIDEQEPDSQALAAMAFVNAWEISQQTVTHCLRVHGGYGFMTEYDIGMYYRRAKALPLLVGAYQQELARLGELLYGSGT
ncbi:acyl-CoA dehydrogenase family protein [Mycolicibacterium sp. XJ1819]